MSHILNITFTFSQSFAPDYNDDIDGFDTLDVVIIDNNTKIVVSEGKRIYVVDAETGMI